MSHRLHTLGHFKHQRPRASGGPGEAEMTYILPSAKAASSTGARAVIKRLLQSAKERKRRSHSEVHCVTL